MDNSSACHLKVWCVLQVGHEGPCSPKFVPKQKPLGHLKEEDRKIFEHPADDDWEES